MSSKGIILNGNLVKQYGINHMQSFSDCGLVGWKNTFECLVSMERPPIAPTITVRGSSCHTLDGAF